MSPSSSSTATATTNTVDTANSATNTTTSVDPLLTIISAAFHDPSRSEFSPSKQDIVVALYVRTLLSSTTESSLVYRKESLKKLLESRDQHIVNNIFLYPLLFNLSDWATNQFSSVSGAHVLANKIQAPSCLTFHQVLTLSQISHSTTLPLGFVKKEKTMNNHFNRYDSNQPLVSLQPADVQVTCLSASSAIEVATYTFLQSLTVRDCFSSPSSACESSPSHAIGETSGLIPKHSDPLQPQLTTKRQRGSAYGLSDRDLLDSMLLSYPHVIATLRQANISTVLSKTTEQFMQDYSGYDALLSAPSIEAHPRILKWLDYHQRWRQEETQKSELDFADNCQLTPEVPHVFTPRHLSSVISALKAAFLAPDNDPLFMKKLFNLFESLIEPVLEIIFLRLFQVTNNLLNCEASVIPDTFKTESERISSDQKILFFLINCIYFSVINGPFGGMDDTIQFSHELYTWAHLCINVYKSLQDADPSTHRQVCHLRELLRRHIIKFVPFYDGFNLLFFGTSSSAFASPTNVTAMTSCVQTTQLVINKYSLIGASTSSSSLSSLSESEHESYIMKSLQRITEELNTSTTRECCWPVVKLITQWYDQMNAGNKLFDRTALYCIFDVLYDYPLFPLVPKHDNRCDSRQLQTKMTRQQFREILSARLDELTQKGMTISSRKQLFLFINEQ